MRKCIIWSALIIVNFTFSFQNSGIQLISKSIDSQIFQRHMDFSDGTSSKDAINTIQEQTHETENDSVSLSFMI